MFQPSASQELTTLSPSTMTTPLRGVVSTTVIDPAARTCQNCQTIMHGPFCYQCGQHERSSLRHAGLLVRDIVNDVLNLDSRAIRTLKPLLFRPGFLTLEFFAGRRQRYVPPIRLYVIASVVFFLIAGLGINFGDTPFEFDGDEKVAKEAMADPEFAKAMNDPATAKAITDAVPAVKEAMAKAHAGDPALPQPEASMPKAAFIGIKDAEDDSQDKVGARLPTAEYLPAFANQWLEEINKELEVKSKMVKDNPKKLVDAVLRVLPQSMFIMLPIFALLLKLFYPFANRLYMEHLIVAVHSHCFLFILFTLLISLSYLIGDATGLANALPVLADLLGFTIGMSLLVGSPLYLYLMQKRVYGQSHTLTAFKFVLIGFVYICLLAIVVAIDVVVGILRL